MSLSASYIPAGASGSQSRTGEQAEMQRNVIQEHAKCLKCKSVAAVSMLENLCKNCFLLAARRKVREALSASGVTKYSKCVLQGGAV